MSYMCKHKTERGRERERERDWGKKEVNVSPESANKASSSLIIMHVLSH